jgi:uncharacterized iron-regulated membrane protein
MSREAKSNHRSAIFERLGIARGYTVNPPKGHTDVYTASVYPQDLSQQRGCTARQGHDEALAGVVHPCPG